MFVVLRLGEISDTSKCFEDFVSQALGFLTRNNAAELRYKSNSYNKYDDGYQRQKYCFLYYRRLLQRLAINVLTIIAAYSFFEKNPLMSFDF